MVPPAWWEGSVCLFKWEAVWDTGNLLWNRLEGPGSVSEPYVTWSIIKYVSCPMGQNEEMSPIHLCDQ